MKSTKVQIAAGIALLMIGCAGGYVASNTVGHAYAQNGFGTQQRVVCDGAANPSGRTERTLNSIVQDGASAGWRTDQIASYSTNGNGWCVLQTR